MNRRITGWLAWGALALIISVPGADLIFSASDDEILNGDAIEIAGLNEDAFGPSSEPVGIVRPDFVDAYEAPFIQTEMGPDELEIATPAPAVAVPLPVLDEAIVAAAPQAVIVADDVLVAPEAMEVVEVTDPIEMVDISPSVPPVEIAEIVEPETDEPLIVETEIVELAVAEPVSVAPVPASPIVAADVEQPARNVRVVAGPDLVVTPVEVETNSNPLTSDLLQRVEDVLTNEDVLEREEIVLAAEPVIESAPDIQVAAIDPALEPLATEPHIVAPVPMPASMRPAPPVKISVSTVSAPEKLKHVPFKGQAAETDARASVNKLRPSHVVNVPLFEDDEFWGSQTDYQSPQLLDEFNIGEFSQREMDPGDGFNRQWLTRSRPSGFRRSGSFEEQLPAYHGDGVRMDLLQ